MKKTFSFVNYFFTTKNSYAILHFVGAKKPEEKHIGESYNG